MFRLLAMLMASVAFPATAAIAQISSFQYLEPTTSKIEKLGNWDNVKSAETVAKTEKSEVPATSTGSVMASKEKMQSGKPPAGKTLTGKMPTGKRLMGNVATGTAQKKPETVATMPEMLKPSAAKLTMPKLRMGEASLPVVQINSRSK